MGSQTMVWSRPGPTETMPVRLPDGSLAAWDLDAGAHRITMENTNNCWLNLDQIAFVPADD